MSLTPHPSNESVELAAQVRFTLASDDLFGKCDDSIEFRLPADMKESLRREAAARRMPMGALLRMLIAKEVLGDEHVFSVVAMRLAGIGAPVRTTAPNDTAEVAHGG